MYTLKLSASNEHKAVYPEKETVSEMKEQVDDDHDGDDVGATPQIQIYQIDASQHKINVKDESMSSNKVTDVVEDEEL